MSDTDWVEAIRQWRLLTPEQQRAIRLRRLPAKVARSMAFAGEPVDKKMLEAELDCLLKRAGAGCSNTTTKGDGPTQEETDR